MRRSTLLMHGDEACASIKMRGQNSMFFSSSQKIVLTSSPRESGSYPPYSSRASCFPCLFESERETRNNTRQRTKTLLLWKYSTKKHIKRELLRDKYILFIKNIVFSSLKAWIITIIYLVLFYFFYFCSAKILSHFSMWFIKVNLNFYIWKNSNFTVCIYRISPFLLTDLHYSEAMENNQPDGK